MHPHVHPHAAAQHLFIVTELLRDSLFNFYRYLNATQPAPPPAGPAPPAGSSAAAAAAAAADVPGCRAYFSSSTLAALSRQLLRALVSSRYISASCIYGYDTNK